MNRMLERGIISGIIITSPGGRRRAPSLAANTKLGRTSHWLLLNRNFLLILLFHLFLKFFLNLIVISLLTGCVLRTGRVLR